jgi:membrane fusion protein, adhesin transport system
MERSRRTLLSVSLGIAILVVWAAFSEIDQTTRVFGSVIASSHSQNVQTTDGGVLDQLMVKEGTKVERGELIAVLDQTRLRAAYQESEAKQAALKAQIARLRSEVMGLPLVFPSELNSYPQLLSYEKLLFQKRQYAIHQEVAALNEMLKLAQEELTLNEPYLSTGDVAKTDILRLKRQVVDLKTQISTKQNKYFQDSQADLAKAQQELNALDQNIVQKKDTLEHTKIYAPMSGTVKNVKFTTIGAVLKPADELLQIVPSGNDLIIEVKIKPQDIAHVKIGDPAIVKIDAYDYTIYGALTGKLSYLSPDTFDENLKQNEQPYYKAQVITTEHTLNSVKGEKIEIQPGMTATVELIAGRNTVLKYLLKPVVKTLSESMNER